MADIDGVPLEDVQNIDGQPLDEDNDKEPTHPSKNYWAFNTCVLIHGSCTIYIVYLKKEEHHSGIYLCMHQINWQQLN